MNASTSTTPSQQAYCRYAKELNYRTHMLNSDCATATCFVTMQSPAASTSASMMDAGAMRNFASVFCRAWRWVAGNGLEADVVVQCCGAPSRSLCCSVIAGGRKPSEICAMVLEALAVMKKEKWLEIASVEQVFTADVQMMWDRTENDQMACHFVEYVVGRALAVQRGVLRCNEAEEVYAILGAQQLPEAGADDPSITRFSSLFLNFYSTRRLMQLFRINGLCREGRGSLVWILPRDGLALGDRNSILAQAARASRMYSNQGIRSFVNESSQVGASAARFLLPSLHQQLFTDVGSSSTVNELLCSRFVAHQPGGHCRYCFPCAPP